MAKYKCTMCPSTIAMHRISAVKCKGKSPTYTEQTSEQTSTKSAPPKASSDVPSGAPKKRTRRGRKGRAKVHTIVSSALVPQSVTKRLQETHHAAAPVAAPISVPVMASTVVGGPSCAPVRVPMTIMLFKLSGVTYTKTEAPKNVQAFSGFTGQEGPHTMRKPPVAWKGMAPSKPLVSLEARMACATIVNNAVVSSSHQTLDPLPAPLLEHIATPTPANYAEHATWQKATRKTCQGPKKAKKDLVHSPPLNPSLKGKNMQVKFFNTDMSEEQIVSYKTYIHHQFMEIANESLDHDPSGEHLMTMFDPYLDAPSDKEQDSSSEDEEKGRSPQLFTLPQDEDTIKEHWEDHELENQHNSHAYDDYGYWRYVSNFDINTVADHQQLLVALGSLSSSVEQYMPHSANCVKCKTNKKQDLIELSADSGTSLNFTHEWSDLSEFQEVHDDDFDMQTAMKWKTYSLVPCLLCTRD